MVLFDNLGVSYSRVLKCAAILAEVGLIKIVTWWMEARSRDENMQIWQQLKEPGLIDASDFFQTFRIFYINKKGHIFLITPNEFYSWKCTNWMIFYILHMTIIGQEF